MLRASLDVGVFTGVARIAIKARSDLLVDGITEPIAFTASMENRGFGVFMERAQFQMTNENLGTLPFDGCSEDEPLSKWEGSRLNP